uniref:Heparan-alpha-glucosaminide N-acetyltransferase catalytic domain-containing protein n=1 Tax=Manihot esculenta TaxID=3983 RepID=A0A2C9VTF8_MANES
MAALIIMAEDEQRQPLLLQNTSPTDRREQEITPSSSSNEAEAPPPPNQRLISLDVFRGLTVALMILVDDAGGALPSINHSPWFGVTLADFVMPFFLFGVGVSIALVFKKISSKPLATKKVILRTVKLFLLGLLLQGGYFHGCNHLTYGVDVGKIRWLGVLQRISIGYLFASISEIWFVDHIMVDSPLDFVKKYYVQWLVVCGMRGSLEPPCNAVGLIDRFFLGEHHLYQRPVYRRTKQCSVNSPDYGPLPPNSPAWCLAPFDPEGILSSLMAAITCFVGLHFGHILVHFKDHMQRLFLWSMSSFSLLISGYVLKLLGIPFSKPLYTLSYMFITAGASGLLLTIIFYVVDVKHFRKPMVILQWVGMNALIVYALAACELFPAVLQGFYWRSPENNLVDGTEWLMRAILHSEKWGTLAFVIVEILFWCLVAGFLHLKGIYVRL